MKNLLLDTLRELKDIPSLKTVSEDWGQIDFYDTRPPVNFPCALVDLSMIEHLAEKGGGINPATFIIRIADIRTHTGNASAPLTIQENAFMILDLINQVVEKINGIEGETYRSVRRILTRKNVREDSIREYQLTFSCKL